jgi:ribonuclease HII
MGMRGLLVGVDEVGRGPIAGPVTVGVFVCEKGKLNKIVKSGPSDLKDSKKLTKSKREAWSLHLHSCMKDGLCSFEVVSVSSIDIDKKGIQYSIRSAIGAGFKKLNILHDSYVLLDGGLRPPDLYTKYQTIIKGDEKEPIIAMASIVAKVKRDGFMTKMALKYPDYGFEKHMGYGTAGHYKALKNKGITPLHRKSYLKRVLD